MDFKIHDNRIEGDIQPIGATLGLLILPSPKYAMRMAKPGKLVIEGDRIDIYDFEWDWNGEPFDVEEVRAQVLEWATRSITKANFNRDDWPKNR